MSKRLLFLALLAGCASPTSLTVAARGEAGATVEAQADPAPTPQWVRPEGQKKASRSRQDRRSPARTGSPPTRGLSSTAYCDTGLMANGHRTYRGAVAGPRHAWPLGTRLRVSDSPYGAGIFTVTDRIGHGSQLDFAMPGDCAGARRWGRRTVQAEVIR